MLFPFQRRESNPQCVDSHCHAQEFNLNTQSQTDATGEMQEKAEIVRAYLSAARGGALFLSAADADILMKWLHSNIQPAAIMAAIDKLAKKRQQQMSRRRFTLKACKGELNKLLKRNVKKTQKEKNHGLMGLSQQIKSMDTDLGLRKEKLNLIDRLREIALKEMNRETMATEAISACQAFQNAAWKMAQEDAEELLKAAEAELESLKDLLGCGMYQEAVEEHMRNAVRSRYQLCTAQAVWTAMNSGKENQ